MTDEIGHQDGDQVVFPFVDSIDGTEERLAGHYARGTFRPVTVIGNPVLHAPCADVTDFDDSLSTLIDDLFVTMKAAHGVGLAANQIGVPLRVFVYACPEIYAGPEDDPELHVGYVINPVIDGHGAEPVVLDVHPEGCLSVPGARIDVGRPDQVVVRGQDRFGGDVVVAGKGLLARCFQHETDHLNGLLYVDRITADEREDALRQMAESEPQYETVPKDAPTRS